MMNQQELNDTFTLIDFPEIEANRYYIRYDGEIFDNKEIKFITSNDIIYLNGVNNNLLYYRKNELLLKVFLGSIYGDDCNFIINTISKDNIENIKDLELYI